MSDSGSSSRYSGSGYASTYPINGSVMTIAVTTLFLVVFFILALHIYAKWFWQRSFAGEGDGGNGNPQNRRQPRQAASVGIDKTTLDLLPTFTYSQSTASKLRLSSECAVCLSEFQNEDTGRLLPSCNHGFHTECIDMWFYSHKTCPLCRTEVKPLSGAEAEEDAADSQTERQPTEEATAGEGMEGSSNIDLTEGSSHGHSHVITIEVGVGGEGGEQQADMAGAGSGANGSAAEMAGNAAMRYEGLRSSIKRILSRQSSSRGRHLAEDIPKDSSPSPPPPPPV